MPSRPATVTRSGRRGQTASARRPVIDAAHPRVLLVEDDPEIPELVAAYLSRGTTWPVSHVTSLASALEAVAAQEFDVALVDLGLPDSAGAATVERLAEAAPSLPLVVLSGADEDVALASVRAGAQDHIPKRRLDGFTLRRVLRYAIERAALLELLHAEAAELRSANERLAEFASTVAHDLKGPLGSLYGLAETLKLIDTGSLSDAQRGMVDSVSEASMRLASVVDRLLNDAQSKEDDRRQKVDLEAIVTDSIKMVDLDTATGRAEVEVVGELPDVWGIPALLGQVFTNLIANALAHHQGPGAPHVQISAQIEDEVVLTVADDGPGVPPELREQIFTPGFTTRRGGDDRHAGLGKGLAMCASAAKQMGGRIWVEDGRLGGADMRLAIPARAAVDG